MTAFTEHELNQIDEAATRNLQRVEWHSQKPTKAPAQPSGLHPVFEVILAAHGMPQAAQNNGSEVA